MFAILAAAFFGIGAVIQAIVAADVAHNWPFWLLCGLTALSLQFGYGSVRRP